MKGLTAQQAAILSFIEEFISINRYSPSYREIADKFGFKSTASVFKHVQALKRKEALHSTTSSSGTMRMTQSTQKGTRQSAETELLLIGEISTAYSLETFPHTQTVDVPSSLVDSPENTYVIRIKGEGFQDDMLMHGDLIIVEARNDPTEGETVIAMINGHDPLIKIYEKESGYVKLFGHNPQQHPMIMHPDDLSVYGVVVGMVRLFHR